jgi:hypothetical protein
MSLFDNIIARTREAAGRLIPPAGERTRRQSTYQTRPLFVQSDGAATSPQGVLPPGVACASMAMPNNSMSPDLARQLGLGMGLSSYAVIPGYPNPTIGTYEVFREMSRDPTFALAIAAANAPIKAAGIGYESKTGVPDERVQFVKDQFEKRWPHIVGECLRGREFGWRGMEKVFGVSPAGQTIFRKLKPLMPERTRILVDNDHGDFLGFKQGDVTLEQDRCFLFTHGLDGDDYYGHALHENGLRAWANWLNTIDNGGRLQRKVSGIVIQLHYPVGTSKDASGNDVDNSVVAQKILDEVGAGRSVAMPNLFYADNAIRNQAELAGKSMWVLSTLEVGDQSGAQATLDTDRRYWDVQKLRAWLVPERAATEGQFGTKAEAEAHADILLAVAEDEHADIIRAANCQLVDDLLVYNFGEDARASVWAVPEPIVDERRAVLKQFFAGLLANPATLELLLSGGETGKAVDVDALLDQLGIPRTDATRQIMLPIVNAPAANGNPPTNGKPIPPGVQNRIGTIYQNVANQRQAN